MISGYESVAIDIVESTSYPLFPVCVWRTVVVKAFQDKVSFVLGCRDNITCARNRNISTMYSGEGELSCDRKIPKS